MLENVENWISGHKCPFGYANATTFFDGNLGYTLIEAKKRCSSGCIANPECYYADLHYAEHEDKQKCVFKGSGCGHWLATTHFAYHLFIKGIDLMPFSEHVSFELIFAYKIVVHISFIPLCSYQRSVRGWACK